MKTIKMWKVHIGCLMLVVAMAALPAGLSADDKENAVARVR